jgi:dTDP-L-rhamnose 4-epimerase
MRKAIIFGGGGFIGSEYYRQFSLEYEKITIVDKFSGPSHTTLDQYKIVREFLRCQDEVFTSDVKEISNWPELLSESTDIFILNADTGTGNSFYLPSNTINENLYKLAIIIEAIRLNCKKEITRIMFTSSRAVYGEGRWMCENHGHQIPDRSNKKLSAGNFVPNCIMCGLDLALEGNNEEDVCRPLSVYGLTKAFGEQMLELTLANTGFDVRIVRYQNVYGIGQAVDNPYTGVLNWFSKALIRNEKLAIYEQGLIVRDFIFVSDAALLLHKLANLKRSEQNITKPFIVNGGSGTPTSLVSAAQMLRKLYGSKSDINLTNDFRTGDVLGALANSCMAEKDLSFTAAVTLDDGLRLYSDWFVRVNKTLT